MACGVLGVSVFLKRHKCVIYSFNMLRFLEHSSITNTANSRQVEGENRIGLFAARDIQVGESLTFYYRCVLILGKFRSYYSFQLIFCL